MDYPVAARSHAAPSWLQRNPQMPWIFLVAPLGIFLAVFFLYPILRVLTESLGLPHVTWRFYAQAFTGVTYPRIIFDTIKLSAIVTVVALAIGYPVAYWLTRAPSTAVRFAMAAILLPLWTSALVRNYAWILILNRNGILDRMLQALGITAPPLLYNQFAVIVGMVYTLLPYTILTLYSGMRQIKASYVRAAAALGATPLQAFVRVYLPLSVPAISSAGFLVFIFGVGFYITPAMLGGGHVNMIAPEIDQQMNFLVQWGFGSALSVILFAIVAAIVIIFARYVDVGLFGMRAEKSPVSQGEAVVTIGSADPPALLPADGFSAPNRPGPSKPPRENEVALAGFSALVLVVLLAPVVIVAATSVTSSSYLSFPPHGFSLQWYAKYLSDPSWMAATVLSLKVSFLSAVVAMTLGTLAAIGFVRGTFAAKQAFFLTALAPAIVPPIVIGVGVYLFFAKIHLLGTIWSFVFTYTALTVPIVILLVSSALRQSNVRLERAAATLGARPIRAFASVTLPSILPAILAGGLFAFITAFDEVVVAQFLAGAAHATLPKLMWVSLVYSIDPTISAISTLLVLLSLAILAVAGVLQRGGVHADA